MAKIIIINKYKSEIYRDKSKEEWQQNKISQAVSISKKGSIKIGLASVGFLFIFLVIFSGAFYLFQVNDLAIKGYNIRELENEIGELEKENKQMKIYEMELRSMYAIEKSAQEFNLVSPVDISYLKVNNTVVLR